MQFAKKGDIIVIVFWSSTPGRESWILPINIKAIEIIGFQEIQGRINEV
jgi:hypothetical protein